MHVKRILMLGNLIGKTGRLLFAHYSNQLRKNYNIDVIIVNGNNCADDGIGITPEDALYLNNHGAHVITSGNHIWDKKSIIPFLETNTFVLRPANLSSFCPGIGATIAECDGFSIGVINVIGRAFMPPMSNCPFITAEKLVDTIKKQTPLIVVDFHAQATAEKMGLGYFLDGKVTAAVGTHTHTQTNDAQILPCSTAYCTDLGFGGSYHSVLGFTAETQLAIELGTKLQPETSAPYILSGVIITADPTSGKALAIEQFKKIETITF